ncbi:MAG: hypothetical protein PHE70_05930 [Tepidanaerobacteraceae bacterium]|nr:hypothetical protein [Tepidanaerobacteraceae bacterium]
MMLVSELRELIKKYKEEDLRLLISEMYKAIPKKLREDKDIDALLQDVHAYLRTRKVKRKQDRQTDVKVLKPEIDLFIDYAYKQYYFAPNSFVHKKERPKWRFKVRTYIKSLQGVSIEGADGKTATDLLEKLYEMLCYACGYYIFSTDNPFRSVGIEQTELLDIVITRKLGIGISKESVKSVIALVINGRADRETLHSSLINVLIANLKTPDSKEIAIEQSMALKAELDKSKRNLSKKSWVSGSSDYEREEKINNLVEMVFKLNVALCEYEKAIKYYNGNNVEWDNEVSLYVLLNLLLEYELKEYWLREYDKAVKKGVKPREALQRTYKYIQKNDKLPEY